MYAYIHVVTSSGKEFTGYFGENDSDGKMLTGKKSNLSVDGETAAYYFSESGSDKGCGYNGSKDDYLYYQGRLVKADSGSDYQVFCGIKITKLATGIPVGADFNVLDSSTLTKAYQGRQDA